MGIRFNPNKYRHFNPEKITAQLSLSSHEHIKKQSQETRKYGKLRNRESVYAGHTHLFLSLFFFNGPAKLRFIYLCRRKAKWKENMNAWKEKITFSHQQFLWVFILSLCFGWNFIEKTEKQRTFPSLSSDIAFFFLSLSLSFLIFLFLSPYFYELIVNSKMRLFSFITLR